MWTCGVRGYSASLWYFQVHEHGTQHSHGTEYEHCLWVVFRPMQICLRNCLELTLSWLETFYLKVKIIANRENPLKKTVAFPKGLQGTKSFLLSSTKTSLLIRPREWDFSFMLKTFVFLLPPLLLPDICFPMFHPPFLPCDFWLSCGLCHISGSCQL